MKLYLKDLEDAGFTVVVLEDKKKGTTLVVEPTGEVPNFMGELLARGLADSPLGDIAQHSVVEAAIAEFNRQLVLTHLKP